MDEMCGFCRYFARTYLEAIDKNAEREPSVSGRCRRYPPTLVWRPQPKHDWPWGDWMQDSPNVQEDDWCGEFAPRNADAPPA